jgi:hypothetical protein
VRRRGRWIWDLSWALGWAALRAVGACFIVSSSLESVEVLELGLEGEGDCHDRVMGGAVSS